MSRRIGPDLFQVALVIAARLQRGEAISCAWLQQRFGVSHATAKRYMVRIEQFLPVERVRPLGAGRQTRKFLQLMDAGAKRLGEALQ